MSEVSLFDRHQQHEAFGRLADVSRMAAIYGSFGGTDPQTGLANRRGFDGRLRQLAAEPAGCVGLIVLDIDHLRIVNETQGRNAGDAVLREVARRLAALPGISAYRTGTDEFTLVVEACRMPERLPEAAGRIQAALIAPPEGGQGVGLPKVTMGGSVRSHDGVDPREILVEANLALCYAKDHARGGFLAFRPEMRRALTEGGIVLERVATALDQGRIVPFYQPLVDTRSARIIGVEALVRMRTRKGRILGPQDFAEALCHPLLSVRITDAMLRQIAGHVGGWLKAGIPFKHVGINLAPADLRDPAIGERLAGAFGKAGVPLKHIVLEITETTYLGRNGEDVSAAIRRLRGSGFLVALDDFGTGYASLTHLLGLPVDIVKIDRSFVEKLPADAASAAVVSGLVAIAKDLGMRVVAEGIERMDQAQRLSDIGVEIGQGFLFSHAIDAPRMEELLRRFSTTAIVPMERSFGGLPIGVC